MSTPPLILSAGGPIRIGPDGGLASVRHDDRPDRDYLQAWVPRTAAVTPVGAPEDAEPVGADWVLTERTDEADECEVSYAWRADRSVHLQLRHAVTPRWSERWTLSLDPAAAEAVDVILSVELALGPEIVGRGRAAGSEAWFATLPADGAGPVLGVRLQSGSATGLADGRLTVGPIRLRPGWRQSVTWLLDWYATPWAFHQQLATLLPPVEALTVGEVWDLPPDPDRVLLCHEELTVVQGPRSTELSATEAGRYRIELRSAQGTVQTDLAWAPTLARTVGRRVADLLERAPRTRAGTPRLDDPAAALVLQYALGAVLVDDRETAAEALELYVGELTSAPGWSTTPVGPFARIVIAREVLRGAEPSLLDLPPSAPEPGAGLAAAQLALAGVVAGRPRPPEAVVAPPVEQALLGPGTLPEAALTALLRAVGATLGGGLGGLEVTGQPDDVTAYRIALLSMAPEQLDLTAEWGCSLPVLAERSRAGLLSRPELSLAALGWLCVAEPQR